MSRYTGKNVEYRDPGANPWPPNTAKHNGGPAIPRARAKGDGKDSARQAAAKARRRAKAAKRVRG